ncbi:MAG TPA: hypothetical protein VFY56_10760 [Propionibacteriaceae bacterium]|nr:hypothetical protein [Propionibacteriaceae bacterium]
MKDLTKIIVAGAGTAALAGGIGAGLAYADTPTDSRHQIRPRQPRAAPPRHLQPSPAGGVLRTTLNARRVIVRDN